MKTCIVIPAYNEDTTLQFILDELKKHYSDIIVVDDGSTDNTYQQSLSSEIIVLSHLINRGQGAALATGIKYALSKGADIIVTFDADGQHSVSDIPKIIQPIIDNQAEIVLGSRFLSQETKVPLFRKIILKLAIIFTWLISGIRLTDAHNGFRGFSREAALKVTIRQDRMAHSSEIIDEIKRHKLAFVEAPVKVNYTKYSLQKGQSAFDSLKIAKDILFKKLIK